MIMMMMIGAVCEHADAPLCLSVCLSVCVCVCVCVLLLLLLLLMMMMMMMMGAVFVHAGVCAFMSVCVKCGVFLVYVTGSLLLLLVRESHHRRVHFQSDTDTD